MRKLIYLSLILIFFSCHITVFAHPGRTDSNGGHYNRDTGEYHYHNGQYAGQSNKSNSDDYTYSHFEGPTQNYSNTSDYNVAKETNKTDSLSMGSIIITTVIVSFCGIGAIVIILTLYEKIKPTKTNNIPLPQTNSVDDILEKIRAERIKRAQELSILQEKEHTDEQEQEQQLNAKENTNNHLEQIAGFPDGIYINGFILVDTKSKEPYGRATAYINNKDKILHLFCNCKNATQPINMLFDTYEMKNFELCEQCKKSQKYEFYKNVDVWYKKFITLKIEKDKENENFK